MLGRLATWMRMIGCDVAYDSLLEDKGLIEQAEREERIILTRDTHLIKRKKVRNITFCDDPRFGQWFFLCFFHWGHGHIKNGLFILPQMAIVQDGI